MGGMSADGEISLQKNCFFRRVVTAVERTAVPLIKLEFVRGEF